MSQPDGIRDRFTKTVQEHSSCFEVKFEHFSTIDLYKMDTLAEEGEEADDMDILT
jgi:hypothetical protein